MPHQYTWARWGRYYILMRAFVQCTTYLYLYLYIYIFMWPYQCQYSHTVPTDYECVFVCLYVYIYVLYECHSFLNLFCDNSRSFSLAFAFEMLSWSRLCHFLSHFRVAFYECECEYGWERKRERENVKPPWLKGKTLKIQRRKNVLLHV